MSLADSAQPDLASVATMPNHDDRPEVVRALSRGEGIGGAQSASQRRAVSLFRGAGGNGWQAGRRGAFVAAAGGDHRTDHGQAAAGVERAAVVFLAALGAFLLGDRPRRRSRCRTSTRPSTRSRRAIFGIGLYVPNRDELGQIAGKLNRMGQELDHRLTQLTASHERQATVLGGMIEGVIAVDRRERVLFANAAAGRLFDFRPTMVEGRRLLEVVRNHTLEEAVSAALATRQPQRLETTQEGGDKMSVAIQATPLPGEPCPGVVIVMHETTELRRLESLRRDFVANVSHELKTPLSSIKAYAETLRNGALDDPQASVTFVERIQEQAERLHHLILDMLSLARIESAQQVFEIVPVSVQEVVDECFANYRPAADAKRIELDCRAACSRAALSGRTRKACARFSTTWSTTRSSTRPRAVASSFAGGRRRIGRWRRSKSRTRASASRPRSCSRVFERFYRVDKARSRELGGTGLGLAIVKHLAQSFGGGVSATSESGRGSRFTVELPLA